MLLPRFDAEVKQKLPTAKAKTEACRDKPSIDTTAFAQDGRQIVLASAGTARLWTIAGTAPAFGRELARMAHPGTVRALALDEQGKYLVTASTDYTARVWLLRPNDLVAEVCKRVTRNLTPPEWELFLRQEGWPKICSDLR
jgi:WD40 repeat protein